MRIEKRVIAIAAFLVLAAPVAVAQETTGGLQGSVGDHVGTPIAGAIVEANGPLGAVNTTTDAVGKYRFPRLAAGSYTVTASFTGYTPNTAENVRVSLGEFITVDIGLKQTSFTEEIMVYSDTVAIDFTESATTTSIRQFEIDNLPRGRDFTDVVSFAAGTVEDNQAGGISVDGASGLENRFVIDGIDTTDPEIGEAAIPMRAEMMEEVQVKSAGYMAEYGGALGGVINAVTRSGSNEFHGSLFVDIENNSWNGSARPEVEYDLEGPGAGLVTYDKDDEKRYDPGFTIGGPIIRDRWWFFASYQPGIRNTNRTVDWVSYPAERFTQDFQVDYATFNTTFNLSSALLLKAGLNFSPYTREGFLPNRDGRSDLPGQENWAPLGTEGERETYYLTADWIVSDNFVVSGRGGFYHTNVTDVGIPTFDVIHNYRGEASSMSEIYPEIPDNIVNNYNWYSDNLQSVEAYNTYERTAAGIDATWYFSGAGDHSLKVGYQNEEIYNTVADGYNADRIMYYWDQTHTTTASEVVRGEYGVFRLLNISTFGEATTNNQAVFIQDNWQVTPNLTLNIGVRSENEAVPNYGATGPNPAISFDWGDKLAPRLGFAWDVTSNAKWKVFGSFGKYYDVTKYAMARGSFGGDKWVDYWFEMDDWDIYANEAAGTCRTGSNTIFDRPECPAGTFIEASDRRLNSADPETWEILGFPTIEPDMKPMENWEGQLGVEHQLNSTIQLGARLVHKEIVRTIEDVGLLWPGVGEVYIISNPGEGVTAGYELPYVKPVREYDAVEFTFDKRFADNWSLRAYYTLSKLWGNYSGLSNSDEQNSVGDPLRPVATGGRRTPNTSRLWDVAGSAYDENGDPVYGNLPTNRTHQLGAQFLYSFPIGFNIGVNQYIGSGTPVSTMGSIPSFYPYGRGDQGETPWLTQTDLSLNYTFTFGGNLALSAGLTVLNLFDEDTATRQWSQTADLDIAVTDEDFITGFNYAEKLAELGPAGLDTRHGLWDTYQLPREIRFTIKFAF
jgi:hypothetical protein